MAFAQDSTTVAQTAEPTKRVLPLTDPSFYIEIAIKQGIPGVIALFCVYTMVTRQEVAIEKLSSNIAELSQKIDRLEVRQGSR